MGVLAGIGSFQRFYNSVCSLGLSDTQTFEYPDHHAYTADDSASIIAKAEKEQLDGIVTTRKDWVKLEPLLKKREQKSLVPFFVIDVAFAFLTQEEHATFAAIAKKVVQNIAKT